MPKPEIKVLLDAIDQAYNRKSWHGTNLRGSLRNVTAEEAARRPQSGRHNIWELVVHAAYWKYIVHRRLVGAPAGSFPLKGSNWFSRPGETATEPAWKKDIALLDDIHRSVRSAIADLNPKALSRKPAGSKVSNLALITGIAAHDVYHAGQIQLLKRFIRPG
ncbi:MAG TPA: DinB family protein [Terriglobia bacterium]|nr:DinB family protein [Terriglobia bacterium]